MELLTIFYRPDKNSHTNQNQTQQILF